MKNDLSVILIDLLAAANEDQYASMLTEAKEQYRQTHVLSELFVEKGFNEWFVHDYRSAEGLSFLDEREEALLKKVSPEAIEAFRAARTAFYEVVLLKDKVIFKNIFTKEDHLVKTTGLIDGASLYFATLYPDQEGYVMIEEPQQFDGSYKSFILKTMMDKYNEHKNKLGFDDMPTFVDKNRILFYYLANILEELIMSQTLVDDYRVYQSVYYMEDKSQVVKTLQELDAFEPFHQEESVYRLFLEGELQGEIILTKDRLEAEYTSPAARSLGHDFIMTSFAGLLVHMKDEEITMDELL